MASDAGTTGPGTAIGAYAPINGLDLYYEVHGSGRPLVLLHGGILTIESTFGPMLPFLARHHHVIAVELQGHGHTRDTEREMSVPLLAGDVAALLRRLGIGQADVWGFSLGGFVTVELALQEPALVGHLQPARMAQRLAIRVAKEDLAPNADIACDVSALNRTLYRHLTALYRHRPAAGVGR